MKRFLLKGNYKYSQFATNFHLFLSEQLLILPMAKNKNTSDKKVSTGVVVSDKVGSYENHPFFVAKANEAKAFLQKAGLPPQLQQHSK
jgi:hypothetical protein